MDARSRFGIIACPECDRIIWWVIPAEGGPPHVSAKSDPLLDSLDSFDRVELIMTIEEEFKIEIPDEDAEKLKSIEELIEYIDKHRKKEMRALSPRV